MMRIVVPDLLKERGWTITRLVNETGLSYPTALRLAHGNVIGIKLETIDKLCDVFNVGIDELIVRDSLSEHELA